MYEFLSTKEDASSLVKALNTENTRAKLHTRTKEVAVSHVVSLSFTIVWVTTKGTAASRVLVGIPTQYYSRSKCLYARALGSKMGGTASLG